MVGSKKYFLYTSDSGSQYAIQLDESNTEQLNGTAGDYTDSGTNPQITVPRNITPRFVEYVSANNLVTRKVTALTLAALTAAPPTFEDPVSGLTLTLRRKRGEKVRIPYGADTGQDDGDAS